VQGTVTAKEYIPWWPGECGVPEHIMGINQSMIPFTLTPTDAYPDITSCDYITNAVAQIGYAEYTFANGIDCDQIGIIHGCNPRPFYISSYGVRLYGREKILVVGVQQEQTFFLSREVSTIGQCLPYHWQNNVWNYFTPGGIWYGALLQTETVVYPGLNRYRVGRIGTSNQGCDSPIGSYFYEDENYIIDMVVS